MSIKEKIGNRITQSRKALGITIKELAERTGELSAARISNWEQGTRSPGPNEAKLLAQVLNVSASFLLCLTDNPSGELSSSSNAIRVMPIITLDKAHLYESALDQENILEDIKTKIIIDNVLGRTPGQNSFAVLLTDNSMEPEFNKNDLIIVDTDVKPNPGDFVVAHIPNNAKNFLRKYSESYSSDSIYQLLPNNDLWPVIEVKAHSDAIMIGTVIEHRRFFE